MSRTIRNKGRVDTWLRGKILNYQNYLDGMKCDYVDPERLSRCVAWLVRDHHSRDLNHGSSNKYFDAWANDSGHKRAYKKWQRRRWAKSNRKVAQDEIYEGLNDYYECDFDPDGVIKDFDQEYNYLDPYWDENDDLSNTSDWEDENRDMYCISIRDVEVMLRSA